MSQYECIICNDSSLNETNKIEQVCHNGHVFGEVAMCERCVAESLKQGHSPHLFLGLLMNDFHERARAQAITDRIMQEIREGFPQSKGGKSDVIN